MSVGRVPLLTDKQLVQLADLVADQIAAKVAR
jgi:hypothetical protein